MNRDTRRTASKGRANRALWLRKCRWYRAKTIGAGVAFGSSSRVNHLSPLQGMVRSSTPLLPLFPRDDYVDVSGNDVLTRCVWWAWLRAATALSALASFSSVSLSRSWFNPVVRIRGLNGADTASRAYYLIEKTAVVARPVHSAVT